jgi:hypothetical protein
MAAEIAWNTGNWARVAGWQWGRTGLPCRPVGPMTQGREMSWEGL